jgi:hypothetical protein
MRLHAATWIFLFISISFQAIGQLSVDFETYYNHLHWIIVMKLKVLKGIVKLSLDASLDNGKILKLRAFRNKSSKAQGT